MENQSSQSIEAWTKYFLSCVGKKITVEANLKISRDEYGDEVRDCERVDGLEFRFDNFYIKGYQYHDIYCIEISFVNSGYTVGEDGKIHNYNDHIWLPYFTELYYSISDLIENQRAGEEFFREYKNRIPWKKFKHGYTDEETKVYIQELGITLIAKQYTWWETCEVKDRKITYKIYNDQECVCDTEKNVFIDGEWKNKLINYIEEKERKKIEDWRKKSELENKANYEQAYTRLRSLKNRSNNDSTPNYPQY